MRKVFCFLLLIVLLGHSNAQLTTTHILTKESLLEKSKKQKKTASILLLAGGVLFATAILLPKGEYQGWEANPITGLSEKYSNDGVRGLCGTFGILSMLGSVPFYIASSRSKKKAMALSVKNEAVPQLYNSHWTFTPVPSVTVKLDL